VSQAKKYYFTIRVSSDDRVISELYIQCKKWISSRTGMQDMFILTEQQRWRRLGRIASLHYQWTGRRGRRPLQTNIRARPSQWCNEKNLNWLECRFLCFFVSII